MGSECPPSLHLARDLKLEKVNKARNKAKAKTIHVVRNAGIRILFSLLNSSSEIDVREAETVSAALI